MNEENMSTPEILFWREVKQREETNKRLRELKALLGKE